MPLEVLNVETEIREKVTRWLMKQLKLVRNESNDMSSGDDISASAEISQLISMTLAKELLFSNDLRSIALVRNNLMKK